MLNYTEWKNFELLKLWKWEDFILKFEHLDMQDRNYLSTVIKKYFRKFKPLIWVGNQRVCTIKHLTINQLNNSVNNSVADINFFNYKHIKYNNKK